MFQTQLSKVRNVKFQSCLKSWSLNQLDCIRACFIVLYVFFFNKSLTIGAVERDTFTVVNYRLLQRKIGVVRVTGLSRDKFTLGNIHGYVKKKKETAHDI